MEPKVRVTIKNEAKEQQQQRSFKMYVSKFTSFNFGDFYWSLTFSKKKELLEKELDADGDIVVRKIHFQKTIRDILSDKIKNSQINETDIKELEDFILNKMGEKETFLLTSDSYKKEFGNLRVNFLFNSIFDISPKEKVKISYEYFDFECQKCGFTESSKISNGICPACS